MKLIRFIVSIISFVLGILVLVFVIKTRQQLSNLSFSEILLNIFKYPKLLFVYLITLVCFVISIKNSYKATKSSVSIIKIISMIILFLSISGILVEFIIIKKGGLNGIF